LASIDEFARLLLEESKRFLERARSGKTAAEPNLHAALLLAFCSLEAHINAISEEVSSRPKLSIHERGMLLEQDVRLEDGKFVLASTLKMSRLEDRIKFLCVNFGTPVNLSETLWSQLGNAMRLRNKLIHPKDQVTLTESSVGAAIQAIINVLDTVYRVIYKKHFPAANRGLASRLNF